MSGSNLTALSPATFPQHSSQHSGQEISSLMALVNRAFAQAELSTCDFEDEHCDCFERATVHDLASEKEFCERHFALVNRRMVTRG